MTVLNEIEDAKAVYDYASKLPGVTGNRPGPATLKAVSLPA